MTLRLVADTMELKQRWWPVHQIFLGLLNLRLYWQGFEVATDRGSPRTALSVLVKLYMNTCHGVLQV